MSDLILKIINDGTSISDDNTALYLFAGRTGYWGMGDGVGVETDSSGTIVAFTLTSNTTRTDRAQGGFRFTLTGDSPSATARRVQVGHLTTSGGFSSILST